MRERMAYGSDDESSASSLSAEDFGYDELDTC